MTVVVHYSIILVWDKRRRYASSALARQRTVSRYVARGKSNRKFRIWLPYEECWMKGGPVSDKMRQMVSFEARSTWYLAYYNNKCRGPKCCRTKNADASWALDYK